MTNRIEEAVRLEVQDREEAATWHDFGAVIAAYSPRQEWRGVVEVKGVPTVAEAAEAMLRDALFAADEEAKTVRARFTLADGQRIEGPFVVESFAGRVNVRGLELVLASCGDQEVSGDRDPVFEAERNAKRVVALVETTAAGVVEVMRTLIETRPSELDGDEAVSAVVSGGLVAVVGTMRAADPTADFADLEDMVVKAVREIVRNLAK